jgi:hypothetical protein
MGSPFTSDRALVAERLIADALAGCIPAAAVYKGLVPDPLAVPGIALAIRPERLIANPLAIPGVAVAIIAKRLVADVLGRAAVRAKCLIANVLIGTAVRAESIVSDGLAGCLGKRACGDERQEARNDLFHGVHLIRTRDLHGRSTSDDAQKDFSSSCFFAS